MQKTQRILTALLFSCAAAAASAATDAKDDQHLQRRIDAGARLLASGKAAEAIAEDFDPMIAEFEAQYGASKERVYEARSSAESLVYLMEASTRGTPARVLHTPYAYAYYLKAYALIELRHPAEARGFLDKAIELEPYNAQFLTELGNRYQKEKNWDKALATFAQAEQAARTYSLESEKKIDLARTWRGRGFVLVELGRLAEAEALYLKCLELDSGDKAAAGELKYVRGLLAKQAAH